MMARTLNVLVRPEREVANVGVVHVHGVGTARGMYGMVRISIQISERITSCCARARRTALVHETCTFQYIDYA